MSNRRRKNTGQRKLADKKRIRLERGAKKLAAKALRAIEPARRWF
jgi:hypothetical protein